MMIEGVAEGAAQLRRTLQAIFWMHQMLSPWRDVPAAYEARQKAANRFYRWRRAGAWEGVLRKFQRAARPQASSI
jgi:transposase